MSTVVTLTMNPALDVSTDAPTVSRGEKIRCGPTVLDPGGGGVNVSRVIDRLGEPTRAVYLTGGLAGGVYDRLVEQEGLPSLRIPIVGDMRESFTVTETSTGGQFRFVLSGPVVTADEVQVVVDTLDAKLAPGDWLVASGSLPPGVPEDFYGRLAARYAAKDIRVIVDTAPPWLAPAISDGVYLVKPSRHELEEYLGEVLPDLDRQVTGARQMLNESGATLVALSLGSEGAVLVSGDAAWHSVAPGIIPVSTVGAGDSFVAGIVAALHAGKPLNEALADGVAAGSATAQTPGTTLCDAHSVAEIKRGVVTTTLVT